MYSQNFKKFVRKSAANAGLAALFTSAALSEMTHFGLSC